MNEAKATTQINSQGENDIKTTVKTAPITLFDFFYGEYDYISATVIIAIFMAT